MNSNTRIELTDTMMSALVKMAEGNPGAIAALSDTCQKAAAIDPQSSFGMLSPILSLDTHGIYGSSIYVLWNDVCGRDARKLLMLLRAVQLGFLAESRLITAAADQSRGKHFTAEELAKLDAKVCTALDGFQRATP